MNILIVAATKEEILPLLGKYTFQYFKADNIYSHLSENKIDILITGVGMSAMAFAMGKYAGVYDIVLNAGIAGSFNKKIKIGDVVEVTEDTFSELGAEDGEKFLTIEEMGLKESWKFGVRSQKFEVGSRKWSNEIINLLPKVNGITVNKVHGNEASIKKTTERLNPDIETMEGAAFMFACEKLHLPHAQVRAISNYVEMRDKSKWDIPLAIKNLNSTLVNIIESL